MKYKTLKDINVNGKKVLVRLDLNVPIKEGKVKDTTRIDESLETIRYILDKGGNPILMSHLGRPEGKKVEEFSLKPVALTLAKKLSLPVTMAPDCIGKEVEEICKTAEKGEIILLENLRFYPGEEANSPEFVMELSKLGDCYVNDAFGTAHRAHASTYGLPLRMKNLEKDIAAGFLMDKELNIWRPIIESKGKGVAIVGGAKLEEKMKAVKKLSKTFDRIILGGVVANVFMKAADYNIADSRYLEKNKDFTEAAKELLGNNKIILPSNVAVSTKDFKRTGTQDPKKGCPVDHIFADVLPSADDINAIKEAAKIVWFGPMGAYEFGFTEGSKAIVSAISQSEGVAVIGGGDLAAAAAGVKAKISTGGGASIQYITTGKLEALEALS